MYTITRISGKTIKYFRHAKDYYPIDTPTSEVKKLLKVKKEFREAKLGVSVYRYYGAKQMSTLVRQIYDSFWELVVEFVISGKGAVVLPETHFASTIGVQHMEHNFKTPLGYETFIDNNRVPILTLRLNRQAFHDKRPYRLHLNDKIYEKLFENYNSGVKFISIPYSWKKFLPALEQKYSFIEPDSIKKILQHLQNNVTRLWRNKQTVVIRSKDMNLFFYLPSAVPQFMTAPVVYRKYEAKKASLLEKFGNRK